MLRDAVLYRMMLLGEIASALPDDPRDRHPDVAWRQIRAFRNLAVHRYFGVDWAVGLKDCTAGTVGSGEAGAGDHHRRVPRVGQDVRAGTHIGAGYRILTRSR
jgi:ribonuclease HepT-like protein